MTNSLGNTESLPSLPAQERLDAYNLILQGCSHIWSKNELQKEKARKALEQLIPLTKNDPYFLAHLTSYAMKNSKSKDLHVFLTYVSALSSADGTPFSQGSEYMKPNLRYVGAAALHMLDPKLVSRVVDVANIKYGVPTYLNDASHFPMGLRTAVKKYLEYMNQHPERVAGIKKAGLGNVLKNLYRKMRMHPTDEAAKALRWEQKDHHIEFDERPYDFTGKADLDIATLIRDNKIPYLGVLAELARTQKKISPVIAVAMLEQATGNQAVIMRSTFEDAGILNDPEVMKLYEEKIKEAKTTLDRVDAVAANASKAVKEALVQARADVRKEQVGDIGKIFMHLDDSGSMQGVRQYAIDHGAIFAECVSDPATNFNWGMFGSRGTLIPIPTTFVKDAFAQALFGVRDGGSTDCFALYDEARKFGADVDVFVSDQGHTDGNLTLKIRKYHEAHPDVAKPRACIIVDFAGGHWGSGEHAIKDAYEANGIPAVEMKPQALTESSLVSEAVKTAIQGPIAVIDEIMDTELLKLPAYYYSL